MFNILEFSDWEDVQIMLGDDVPTWLEALYYLEHYRSNYGVGVPYYNGKGEHKGVFAIVRYDEDAGVYRMVH